MVFNRGARTERATMSIDMNLPTLSALEELLANVNDEALRTEALKLCATARTVEAATRLQLQGALASIRAGRPDEALALIERAVAIGQRWVSA